MKQTSNNDNDVLGAIHKIQEQIVALERKVDVLLRALPEPKFSPKPPVHQHAPSVQKQPDRDKGRHMHKAICADCRKECEIPFKPSGDRPVYCQDCFSRRKMINMSGMKVEHKPAETIAAAPTPTPKAESKPKKKAVAVKKVVAKKKTVVKKAAKKK